MPKPVHVGMAHVMVCKPEEMVDVLMCSIRVDTQRVGMVVMAAWRDIDVSCGEFSNVAGCMLTFIANIKMDLISGL